MDWNGIIIGLLSTTTLGGIVGSIVYYRENKKLKKNEVKNSDTEVQEKQIDLGAKFAKEVLDLIERVEGKQDSASNNQAKMLAKMEYLAEQYAKLDERMNKLEEMQGRMVGFLNGEFQDHLRRMYGVELGKPKKESAE